MQVFASPLHCLLLPFSQKFMQQYNKCPYCNSTLERHEHKQTTTASAEVILLCKPCNRDLDIADWYDEKELEQCAEKIIERAIDERKPVFVN